MYRHARWLLSYTEAVVEWMQNMMDSMGYLGIFLLMVLENLFPPIPSELIMPSAGFAAARGEMSLAVIVLVGGLASVVGTLPLYYVGRAFGLERCKEWADRHGKWLTVSGDDLQKASDWFNRHGNKAVLMGRMVPGVRSLLSLPAGVARMALPRFLIYSFVGSLLWSALLSGAGYLLGEHYDKVEVWVGPMSKIILGVLVVAFGIWIYKRKRQQALSVGGVD